MSAFALGAVQLIFLVNLFRSIRRGEPAPEPMVRLYAGVAPGSAPAIDPYAYPQVKMDIS